MNDAGKALDLKTTAERCANDYFHQYSIETEFVSHASYEYIMCPITLTLSPAQSSSVQLPLIQTDRANPKVARLTQDISYVESASQRFNTLRSSVSNILGKPAVKKAVAITLSLVGVAGVAFFAWNFGFQRAEYDRKTVQDGLLLRRVNQMG